MKPSLAPAAPAALLDYKKSLLETFAINERANQLLVRHVADAAGSAALPTGKGRSNGDIACHIHNVRLMWLAAAPKTAKHDPEKAAREDVQAALKASADAIRAILSKAVLDLTGRVPQFKPDVVAFVGYLIGSWEWGTLWREAGSAK